MNCICDHSDNNHEDFGIACLCFSFVMLLLTIYDFDSPIILLIQIMGIMTLLLAPICFLWNRITKIINGEGNLK